QDFTDVPRLLTRAVEVGLLASVLAIIILPTPLPAVAAILLVAYLVLVLAYDTWAFARQATITRGVTRRRMQAAAAGSLCVGLALCATGIGIGLPDLAELWVELGAALGLASGVCYFVAFAPPTWLRRAWQDPELRAFLGRASSLPHLPTTHDIVLELERGTADALGATGASIALWDSDTRRLRVEYRPPAHPESHYASATPVEAVSETGTAAWEFDPSLHPVTGRAFLKQRATLVTDALRADPANAPVFQRYHATAILSAPITLSEKRLGLLNVYAPRAPVFANSDLELVQFMADQAAVILQTRSLIEESANMRAREEAVRLKEDFLSSAAHDLKTPLTSLITQAQVLLRRTERNPHAPADTIGLTRLLEQSLRLKNLMLTNLIENALKYSPLESRVQVRLWAEDGEARISVQDRGIGIPTLDQPLVFERFHRARNVDDRRFAGMGLGLYITRGIVLQHGGRVWLESTPREGSTFFVAVKAVVSVSPELVRDGSLASA
ncbi:MAG: ATP-binding protein, partial [Chloroflexota bacterium]|nr:ATP-binding protein [Chloroflexota bacterium]